MRETIAMIRQSKADGLFGIGVKPNDCDQVDYEDAVASVIDDIDRLLGSDFAIHVT